MCIHVRLILLVATTTAIRQLSGAATIRRGLRWAFTDWDFPGLRTAVQVQGTLNDNSDIDKGWTVEIAFPWAGMTQLAGGRNLPPEDGDIWRIFLGRFGKLAIGNKIVSNSMSLDAVGDHDNHLPERFTRVSFSTLTTPAEKRCDC